MCTAITYKTDNFYFGRNLDLGYSYGEGVVITPRNYPFKFKHLKEAKTHEAIIGMGIIVNDYPLYFDGVNESGVAMAGLNFPYSYHAFEVQSDKDNIPSFELIPYILSKAKSVKEAKALLSNAIITTESFSEKLKASPLHWIIADKFSSITAETTIDGLKIYDNAVGVLTNEPAFPLQMFNLNNYRHITPNDPENTFLKDIDMPIYCKGMGGIGLPGDMSSMSRFVKATFIKANATVGKDEKESVNQFMHILGAVFQVKGSVVYDDNEYEITLYSSCMNTTKGIYYYKTYANSRINSVSMYNENLDSNILYFYPLRQDEDIFEQN